MSATLRRCEEEGLVESIGPRRGYHLTARGRLVLAHWSALLAMDGEWVLSSDAPPGAAKPDGHGGEFPDRRVTRLDPRDIMNPDDIAPHEDYEGW